MQKNIEYHTTKAPKVEAVPHEYIELDTSLALNNHKCWTVIALTGNSPFSLCRLMLDHPPLNTVYKGKVMLVY